MRARTLTVLLACLLALAGCGSVETYRVGMPETISRSVLGEIVSVPLRAAGARVVPVPCGALRPCIQMLRAGEIDLMPAYTGDAVAVGRGLTTGDAALDVAAAREAFARIDLRLLADLGFEAPYTVVVASEFSQRRDVRAIEDLAGVESGLRIAVPEGYAARPRDGLQALLRRHGISIAPDGVVAGDDTVARVAAVRQGRVDAAIVRDFGQDFAALGLTPLADTLSFYPRYTAIVLVGPGAADDLVRLRRAIEPVAGRLEAADVETVLRDVEVRGWSPGDAARRVLTGRGLGVSQPQGLEQPPTTLAYDPQDPLGPGLEEASRTVVEAFPDRPVELLPTFDPFASLQSGRADLAVADAGRFFLPDQPEGFTRYDPRAEAVAVLGQRYLVALRRGRAVTHRDPLRGPVGLPPPSTTAGRVGRAILAARDRAPTVEAGRDELIRALRERDVDVALMLVTPEGLADVLDADGLVVRGLANWVANYPLIFNEARLPAGTFAGQAEPMDTLSVQLLLASPAPQGLHPLRAGGPAGAGLIESQPLTQAEAEALVRASPIAELPDPVLNTTWERLPSGGRQNLEARRDIADTVVNVVMLAFIGWCLVLLIRRERTRTYEPGKDAES